MFRFKRMAEEKEKKKLCWNCEGSVSVFQENCPYCAVYLGPALSGREEDAPKPPYQTHFSYEDTSIPPSPYAAESTKKEEAVAIPKDENKEETDIAKQTILSMGLLSLGSVFFFFAVILFFFSENGIFTLSWDGAHWYVYFLVSVPLMALGFHFLQGLQEN